MLNQAWLLSKSKKVSPKYYSAIVTDYRIVRMRFDIKTGRITKSIAYEIANYMKLLFQFVQLRKVDSEKVKII